MSAATVVLLEIHLIFTYISNSFFLLLCFLNVSLRFLPFTFFTLSCCSQGEGSSRAFLETPCSPPPPHLSLPPFFSSPLSLHSTVNPESGTDSISIESPGRPTPSPFPLSLSRLMAVCCVFFGLCSAFCTSFLCDFHTPPL